MKEYTFIKDAKKLSKKRIITLLVCLVIFIGMLALTWFGLKYLDGVGEEKGTAIILMNIFWVLFILLCVGQIIFHIVHISKANDVLTDFNPEYLAGLEAEYANAFLYKEKSNVGYFKIGKYHIFAAHQGKLAIAPRADIANVDGISDPHALYELNSQEVTVTFFKHPKMYFIGKKKVAQEIREVLFQVIPGPQ